MHSKTSGLILFAPNNKKAPPVTRKGMLQRERDSNPICITLIFSNL
jgi:hypothetical protein